MQHYRYCDNNGIQGVLYLEEVDHIYFKSIFSVFISCNHILTDLKCILFLIDSIFSNIAKKNFIS